MQTLLRLEIALLGGNALQLERLWGLCRVLAIAAPKSPGGDPAAPTTAAPPMPALLQRQNAAVGAAL